MDDSTDFDNFPIRAHVPLMQKVSVTHMHGLAVYVKEGLSFAWNLSLENSADSYLCFWLAFLHSLPYFFCPHQSPSLPLYTDFDLVWSNVDEVLSIEVLFGDFKIHHKNWLPYSGGADKPGKLCYNFSNSDG